MAAPYQCQGFLVQAGLSGCDTPMRWIQFHLRSCSHVNYTASTLPFVQAKKVRTNRTGSFTRCYTLSVCNQFPLPEMQVCKSTKLTPAVFRECDCCAAFHWKDPDSLPGNSLSTYLTWCGMHLKILRLTPQSRDKPEYKHTFCLLFIASGLLGFSICFKLDTLLTACQRNSLYQINPLKINFAFSS